MNILLINYEFPPLGAGASNATWHIGREMARMGHHVCVLTSGYRGSYGYSKQEGMTVFRCPAVRRKVSESNIFEMISFVISAVIFLPFVVIKHKTDGIICFFSIPCGPLGLWAKILFGIPYIVSLRGGDVPGNEKRLDNIHAILKPLRRLVYSRSTHVVANSEGLRALALKSDPFPISIIPNGVDTNFFCPVKDKKNYSGLNILFAGRLSEQKNIRWMFEKLSAFVKNIDQPLLLHVAGDGPQKKQLQIIANELGISDHVKWYGWVDKPTLLSLYHKSDCFVNPSFCEGMPNTVLEAMACGLPVLASNVPGNNAVVKDKITGVLFDFDDHRKIDDFLTKLISDATFQNILSQNARAVIIKKYSWHKSATGYIDILLTEQKSFIFQS